MCSHDQEHLTVDQFRALLPAFADRTKYPRALVERWIEMMKCAFNPCIWGCFLQWAEANWLAHQLTVVGTPTGVLLATSKRVGDTAVSYSDATLAKTMSNAFYGTPYGQQYLSLLNMLPQGIGLMIV